MLDIVVNHLVCAPTFSLSLANAFIFADNCNSREPEKSQSIMFNLPSVNARSDFSLYVGVLTSDGKLLYTERSRCRRHRQAHLTRGRRVLT